MDLIGKTKKRHQTDDALRVTRGRIELPLPPLKGDVLTA